jgi:hypothetical protein
MSAEEIKTRPVPPFTDDASWGSGERVVMSDSDVTKMVGYVVIERPPEQETERSKASWD